MSERLPIIEVCLTPTEGLNDHWLVEAVDDDGGVHRAEFSGRHAEADARFWAYSAYPEVGFAIVAAPTRPRPPRKPRLAVVGGLDTEPPEPSA